MSWGVTPAGFVRQTLPEIIAELEIEFKAIWPALNTRPNSSAGQTIAIIARRVFEAQAQGEATYLSAYVRDATGDALREVVAFAGITPFAATKSINDPESKIQIAGDDGTFIPTGSVISVVGNPTAKFRTTADITIGTGFPTGTALVDVEALVVGPVLAPAGLLTVIETVITGWNSATNPTDIIPGRIEETDEELRIRFAESIALIGGSSVDAIGARIRDRVASVTAAYVAENASDIVDGAGRPPHSIELIVDGGEEQAIADELWSLKPAGIATFGAIAKVVTDQQGQSQVVKFSRPDEVYIRFIINITTNEKFTEDEIVAAAAIKARVLEFCADRFTQGEDVLLHLIFPIIDETAGLEEITILASRSFSNPPAVPTLDDNIPIAPNEKPIFLDANIVVSVS